MLRAALPVVAAVSLFTVSSIVAVSCASSANVQYGALADPHGYGENPIVGSRGQGTAQAAREPSGSLGESADAIMGSGLAGEDRLIAFFLEHNQKADRAKVARLAAYYREESRAEGINSDVAFAQMCLETGFLRFGGLVTVDMNNFCGLGTTGGSARGVSFPDERTGVRAHVQHLKGYASASPLSQTPVDPRYRYINPKGKAPTVASLSGTWAADRAYGSKLRDLVARIRG